MAQGKKTFSGFETGVLLCIAVLFDLVSFIPGVNIVSGIIGWAVMGFIFLLKGVSFTRHTQVLGTSVIALVIGVIPVLSILPEFTVAVLLNIRSINKKDSTEMKNENLGDVSRITRIPRN